MSVSVKAYLSIRNVSITARPFFEKHGYNIEKEQTVSVGDIEMTNFLMYKTNLTETN